MAIHGEIKINGFPVGRWYAQRVLTSQFGRHTYRWEAWDSAGRHVTGDLKHQYEDGAIKLAQRILSAALDALTAPREDRP